ncbi:MAG: hypothetical protein JWP45_3519 [Mucilaginibacter sp.]|nr:hypothetical protein [Mucilaginibacter sp.]
MATQNTKRIGQRSVKKPLSKLDTLHDTWTVMKPFVHFSIKAVKVIAYALIFIVKHIPKPEEHKPARGKSDKIIKI